MIVKGSYGENVFYEFNSETGHLVINGTGVLREYAFDAEDAKITEKAIASKIETVTIENGITEIGGYAFYGCTSLINIIIPDSVITIGEHTFEGCKNLTSIIIPDSTLKIREHAFEGCKNLTSVTIGKGVIDIGDLAFFGCESLTSVTIPDNVTVINDLAFSNCKSLTSITIPDNVVSIRDFAFSSCTNLTNITIGSNVANIGALAFCKTNLKTKKRAYKAFDLIDNKVSCKGYEYTENEWSDEIDNIEPCERGYHYCDNLFNIFNFYKGEIDKDIAIYECEVGDIVIPHENKFVTNKIKPVKRLYREDVMRILSEGE